MGHITRHVIGWTAPLALVAAGVAACGGDDGTEDARTEVPAAAGLGSDVHLQNQADEIASQTVGLGSDVHLQNLADEIASQTVDVGSDVHLANMAAEAAEREAHLAGARATHSKDRSAPETSTDDYVPGTRHMPVR
jgi:hypothetical protein